MVNQLKKSVKAPIKEKFDSSKEKAVEQTQNLLGGEINSMQISREKLVNKS
jgi:hypothetical protein